jgi:precorrin-6Y C5,15-methyltransferase (decarboxylating)
MENVIIIGMGLSVRDLTAEHLETIRSADILIGGRRHLAAFQDLDIPKREISGNVEETVSLIRSQMQDHRVVVLASGDPLFFGIGGRICRELGPDRVTVRPNISCVAAAFARLNLPWQGAKVVSLHGRDGMAIVLEAIKGDEPVAVLTDPRQTPDWLAGRLLAKGIDHVQLAVFEQLGAPEENFARYCLEQAAATSFAQPNVVIIEKAEKDPAAYRAYLGMREAEFDHEKGLITKSEVRAVTLSKLALSPGLTLWDLGAGCGSVGIEASVLLGPGRIVAVEQDVARADQIRRNAKRFGICNLDVVQAKLPDALVGLPPPDRVFIGGGGRNLVQIISAAAKQMHANGVMVVNTVLIANLQAALQVMSQNGLVAEVVQVQISRGKAMPWDQRFEAQNPVWIVSAHPQMANLPDIGVARKI